MTSTETTKVTTASHGAQSLGGSPKTGLAAVGTGLWPRSGRTNISWNKSLLTVPRTGCCCVWLCPQQEKGDSIVKCEVFLK